MPKTKKKQTNHVKQARERALANERDVPYQSLLKVFLAERLAMERGKKRRAG